MGDARQFMVSLKKYSGKLPTVVGAVQRKLAFDIMDPLVRQSPVRTGWFQNSWFPAVGVASSEVASEFSEDKSAAVAKAKARLTVLSPQTVTGQVPVHITNNLPYGPALADGSSTQAPSGWVQASVNQAAVKSGLLTAREVEKLTKDEG